MAWPERWPPRWCRTSMRLILVIAALMMGGLAPYDFAERIHNDAQRGLVDYVCLPDDCDCEVESFPQRKEAREGGWSARDFLVVILMLGLAFAAGWLSRPHASRGEVTAAVFGIFNYRRSEATTHGVASAIPILNQAETDVVTMLNRRLPPP
jgi:hypothetical protein